MAHGKKRNDNRTRSIVKPTEGALALSIPAKIDLPYDLNIRQSGLLSLSTSPTPPFPGLPYQHFLCGSFLY